VPVSLFLDRPNQRHHPADERPAQEQVQEENGESVAPVPGHGDDSRQKIQRQAEKKDNETEKAGEKKPENIIDH